MKTTIALSLLAASLLFTSCGGGKKTTKTKGLSDQIADCVCGQLTALAKLKKEMTAAPDAQKADIMAKMSAIQEPACLKDLEVKLKALSEEQQAKIETELKAALDKKCGDTMKTLMGD